MVTTWRGFEEFVPKSNETEFEGPFDVTLGVPTKLLTKLAVVAAPKFAVPMGGISPGVAEISHVVTVVALKTGNGM